MVGAELSPSDGGAMAESALCWHRWQRPRGAGGPSCPVPHGTGGTPCGSPGHRRGGARGGASLFHPSCQPRQACRVTLLVPWGLGRPQAALRCFTSLQQVLSLPCHPCQPPCCWMSLWRWHGAVLRLRKLPPSLRLVVPLHCWGSPGLGWSHSLSHQVHMPFLGPHWGRGAPGRPHSIPHWVRVPHRGPQVVQPCHCLFPQILGLRGVLAPQCSLLVQVRTWPPGGWHLPGKKSLRVGLVNWGLDGIPHVQ